MKIKPLFDRIVIKQFDAKEKTESGLFLPASSQEKPQMGKVVFVGQGGKLDGNEIVFYVKPGDTIFYSKFAGMEYKFGNETYTIIRQPDILAVLEEEEKWARKF